MFCAEVSTRTRGAASVQRVRLRVSRYSVESVAHLRATPRTRDVVPWRRLACRVKLACEIVLDPICAQQLNHRLSQLVAIAHWCGPSLKRWSVHVRDLPSSVAIPRAAHESARRLTKLRGRPYDHGHGPTAQHPQPRPPHPAPPPQAAAGQAAAPAPCVRRLRCSPAATTPHAAAASSPGETTR